MQKPSYLRRLDKLEFCRLHSDLFEKSPIDQFYSNWLLPVPRQIIAIARKELRYSCKTADCDIYVSLKKFFNANKHLFN
jgi:hypothetical protein